MRAIVFCGIQGTGKSTFFKDHFFSTHVRLNLDMLRTRHREDILLHACLAARQPFVVDNTNLLRAQRLHYVHLAAAAGFVPVLYYFESDVESALARNAARAAPHRVPDLAVRGAFKKLQPPSPGEGFAEAYRVHLLPDGQYQTEPFAP
jgi:predicted kinase